MKHERFLYMPDITIRLRRGPKTVTRMVQAEVFPQPIKINGRNAWTETQYQKWEAEKLQTCEDTPSEESVQAD
jgi:predicted DNA-binding transcriptional regulator AlpA